MIRPFKFSDFDALIEIFNLNIPRHFAPNEIHDFEDYIYDHNKTYFTISKKDKILGGIGYQLNDKDSIGQIKWIFFHPNHVGTGLGKLALEHCLDLLKSNPSVKKSMVTTSQYAYHFFEKFGFVLIKTERDFWAKGFDLYELEKYF